MRRALVTLVLLLGAGAVARADDVPPPVEVRGRVEPDTVTIGTRFRYSVEVAAVPGVELVVSQPSDRIGDFDIVDFGVEPAFTRGEKTVVTRWYTLVGYEPGDHLVKSPPVQYRMPGEELTEAPGAETRISIESLLAKAENATDIRDIKAPEEVPIDWRPYEVAGAAVIGLAALALVVRRLLGRRGREQPAAPPRPPHEVAVEQLEQLRARGLIAEGAFKEYYSGLSGIVRTYLERRFALRAPEMTTEEFLLTSARGGRLQGAHRRLLGDFLAESDLVKFAKHLPTIDDSERAWAAARRFVDETAAEPAPEVERAVG